MTTPNVRVINLIVEPLARVGGPACHAEPYHVLVPRNPVGKPCQMVWNLVTTGTGETVATFAEHDGISIRGAIKGGDHGPFSAGRRISPTQWLLENDNHEACYQIFAYDVRFTVGDSSGSVVADPTVINTPDPSADPDGGRR